MSAARTLIRCKTSSCDVLVLETVEEVMVLWEASAPFVRLTTHAGPLYLREDEIVLVDTVVVNVVPSDPEAVS